MKIILAATCVLYLLVADGAVALPSSLKTMDAGSLQTITQLFRQALLEHIAVAMNTTVDLDNALKVLMDQCKPKIDLKSQQCKTCSQSSCHVSPNLTSHLNLDNPFTHLKGSYKNITNKLHEVVALLGSKSDHFIQSMKNMGKKYGGPMYFGFSTSFKMFEAGMKMGTGMMETGMNMMHGMASGMLNLMKHLFGRSIDAQTRRCMETCASCKPLLLQTQAAMLTAVCGNAIVNTNNSVNILMSRIQHVYNAVLDKTHPIISQLQYDPSSMRITALLDGHYASYMSHVAKPMKNMTETVLDMAMQYWKQMH